MYVYMDYRVYPNIVKYCKRIVGFIQTHGHGASGFTTSKNIKSFWGIRPRCEAWFPTSAEAPLCRDFFIRVWV